MRYVKFQGLGSMGTDPKCSTGCSAPSPPEYFMLAQQQAKGDRVCQLENGRLQTNAALVCTTAVPA